MEEIEQKISRSGADSVGVAACDCRSGHSLLVGPDVSYHPASVFKIAVMMEVFHQAHQGLFSLEDPLPVRNEFISIADGSPFSLSAADDSETDLYSSLGTRLPIRDVVTRMITRSSNLATNLLIELVTPARVTGFMHCLGAAGLVVLRGPEDDRAFALGLNNAATPRSLMLVLKQLALLKVVSPPASSEMIEIMKRQHFNEGIPALLPAAVPIAHKTGWNGLLYHDAAIIYPPGHHPYVLVIMTSGLADDSDAPALVSVLSKVVYDRQAEWR